MLTLLQKGPSTLETIGAPSITVSNTPPPPTFAETQTAYAAQLAEVPEVPEFVTYGSVLF